MNVLKRYAPVVAWCTIIFFFSSLTSAPTPTDTIANFVLKKTAHVVEYAILYWLTFRAVNESKMKNRNFLGPFLFVLFYAATDEFHQSLVPGRHAKLYDIGFDTLGGLLAWWRLKYHVTGKS